MHWIFYSSFLFPQHNFYTTDGMQMQSKQNIKLIWDIFSHQNQYLKDTPTK